MLNDVEKLIARLGSYIAMLEQSHLALQQQNAKLQKQVDELTPSNAKVEQKK